MTALRRRVAKVVAADACTGCGMCTLLDRGLDMRMTDGVLRPHPVAPPDEIRGATRQLARACPGMQVRAVRTRGATRHPMLGSFVGMWTAWADDEQARHLGASGGVLTALHLWLLSRDVPVRIVSARADPARPARTVPVTITTREQALASAGSRYAPVAVASSPDVAAGVCAVTAKPCEIAALRARDDGDTGPLLLSFFCAGTPNQAATAELVRGLGGPPEDELTELRYRGHGWPGRFVASSQHGSVSADYEQSWGSTLGPATQWRCKICPDGIGESADIVAADSWETDARGYPVFDESAGRSALIARTERGLAAVRAAEAAGFLQLAPLDPDDLLRAQPLQVSRRRFLAARLVGAVLAGRRVPRYRGFGLIRMSLGAPRLAVRTARGTWRRARRSADAA